MASGNILIVEDDFDLRALLHLALQEKGYDVRVAENGKIALNVLAEWTPQVILLDVMMPEMSGLDVMRVLNEQGTRSLYKIIIMTAFLETSPEVIDSGADEIQVKPFAYIESIYEKVAKFIAISENAVA